MSYILQALKESEARRGEHEHQAANDAPQPAVAFVAHQAPSRGSMRWIVLGILGLLIAGAFWLFERPDRSIATEDVTAGTKLIQTPAEAADVGKEIDMRGVKLVLQPVQEPVRQPSTSQPSTAQPRAPRRSVSPPEESLARAGTTIVPEPAQPVEQQPVVPDPYAELPYLRQLPAELQRELPDMRFSVHIYSPSPASRMVKMGDRVLREGQRMTADLTIEAIIPKGVVLRYRDYRFKVPAL